MPTRRTNTSRRRTRAALGGAIAAIAVLVTAAACSSSQVPNGSSASGSGSAGSTSTAAAGGIKVMLIGQFQASTYSAPELITGAQAAIDAANKAGGINGKQIDLLTCNDGGDPNIAANCGRQAVQDNVAAVISGASVYDASIYPLIDAAHIPYIGVVPAVPSDNTNPDSFPLAGATPVDFTVIGTTLVQHGCKKVGIIYQGDNIASGNSVPLVKGGVERAGGTVVKATGVLETTVSYAAPVATLIQAGAQCIGFSQSAAETVKLVTAVRQSSDPKMLLATSISNLTLQTAASLNGMANGALVTTGQYVASPQATPTFEAQMKAIHSNTFDAFSGWSWSSATEFVEVAKMVKGPVTASSILAQLGKTTNLCVESYPACVNYTKPNPNPAYSRLFSTTDVVYTVEGNAYVNPKVVQADLGS